MKSIVLGTVAMATLLTATIGGHAQRLGSDTVDRNGRVDSGVTRLPERPGSDLRHGQQNPTPKSPIPRRSPDLGEPNFPLAPSIGPGSGLLGPEAGRAPARLRSGSETGSGRTDGNNGR